MTVTNAKIKTAGLPVSYGAGYAGGTWTNAIIEGNLTSNGAVTLGAGCKFTTGSANVDCQIAAGCYLATSTEEGFISEVKALPEQCAEGDAIAKLVTAEETPVTYYYDDLGALIAVFNLFGGTVTQLKDMEIAATVNVPAGFKWDLSGKTLTVTA